MSALITLDTVSAATPDGRRLFENLTLSIARERTGLIGRNGAGKSTLLGIMSGALPARTGDVSRTGRIAVLSQNPVSGPQARLADLLGVHADLERLERVGATRRTLPKPTGPCRPGSKPSWLKSDLSRWTRWGRRQL